MFKACLTCGQEWKSAADLLTDPEIVFVGYQSGENCDSPGLFLFNHDRCHGALGVEASSLEQQSDQPLLANSCFLPRGPTAFCLAARSGKLCPPQCVCRFVARMAETIKRWPKKASGE
jgi:hypothetical protein